MTGLSSKTAADRRFAMRDLLKTLNADRALRADAKSIKCITLSNVLNNSTMNLTADAEVKEVYLFEVELYGDGFPSAFVSALDRYINFQTLFEFERDGKYLLYGAYKQLKDGKARVGKYYSIGWRDEPFRIDIPMDAGDMDEVYAAAFDPLIPVKVRRGESVQELVARYEDIVRLERDAGNLQRRMDNEIQPKRRFEMNAELKEMKARLSDLKGEE